MTSTQPYTSSEAAAQQARIATVIYDMLIRGGSQGEQLSAQLTTAYPLAASIARKYATYAQSALSNAQLLQQTTQPEQTQPQIRSAYGIEYQMRRDDFIVRRVHVSSVALFFCMLAAMFTAIRLMFIFGLAFSSASAAAWGNEELHTLLDELAVDVLGNGPKKEAYVWAYDLFNESNLVEFPSSDFSLASFQVHAAPSALVVAVLIAPMTNGLVFFTLGAIFAICVNVGLRMAGGIRLSDNL